MLKIDNQHNQQTNPGIKNENNEILYWSVMLGCTMEELTRALTGVGVTNSQVKMYLKTKKFKLA